MARIAIDPKVDFAFKRLFGVERNAPMLIDLINAVLEPPEGRRVVAVTLADPFNLKEFDTDKLSIVDLKATDQSGRTFIVEMQMIGTPALRKRWLFYWSKNYCGQLAEGDDYQLLKPVVVICFVCDSIFANTPEWHLAFRLQDERHGVVFTDDILLHTIELSKVDPPPDAAAPLDAWVWFLKHADELDPAHLPPTLAANSQIVHAIRELEMIAHNDKEKAEYERRIERLRHERSVQRQLREDGVAQGRLQEIKRTIKVLEKVLRGPVTPDDRLEAMTLSELAALADDLERRCLAAADPE